MNRATNKGVALALYIHWYRSSYAQVMPDCDEATTMSMLGPVTCSALTVIEPLVPPDELVC